MNIPNIHNKYFHFNVIPTFMHNFNIEANEYSFQPTVLTKLSSVIQSVNVISCYQDKHR